MFTPKFIHQFYKIQHISNELAPLRCPEIRNKQLIIILQL